VTVRARERTRGDRCGTWDVRPGMIVVRREVPPEVTNATQGITENAKGPLLLGAFACRSLRLSRFCQLRHLVGCGFHPHTVRYSPRVRYMPSDFPDCGMWTDWGSNPASVAYDPRLSARTRSAHELLRFTSYPLPHLYSIVAQILPRCVPSPNCWLFPTCWPLGVAAETTNKVHRVHLWHSVYLLRDQYRQPRLAEYTRFQAVALVFCFSYAHIFRSPVSQ